MPGLRVSQVAAAVGMSPEAVRFYERDGLLPAAERSPAGYRLYGEAVIERIAFIHACQGLGLRLAQIRDLLAIRDTGECPCGSAQGVLRERLVEVDQEIERLHGLRQELTRLVAT